MTTTIGKFLADGGMVFHKIKTGGTVAHDGQNAFVRILQLCRDGIGKSHRQAAVKTVIQISPALADGPGHAHPGRGIAAVGDNDVVFPIHEIVDLLGQPHGMDGQGAAFPHGFGLLLAVLFGLPDGFHPGLELFPEGGADGLFIQDAVQFRQEGLDVADDAQIDGAVPSDLIRQRCRPE